MKLGTDDIGKYRPDVSKRVTRYKTTISLILLLSILFINTNRLTAQEDSSQVISELRSLPSSELARAYLNAKKIIDNLELAEKGINIVVGEVTISKQNVEELRTEYEWQLRNQEKVIRERGFREITGTYKAKAGRVCSKTQSYWAAWIQMNAIETIAIDQQDYQLRLIQDVKMRKESMEIELTGIIVESSIFLNDPMNTDFVFIGEVNKGKVHLQPDTDQILETWPKWVQAPKKKHLENCTIELALK